jgi:hypothetical protein
VLTTHRRDEVAPLVSGEIAVLPCGVDTDHFQFRRMKGVPTACPRSDGPGARPRESRRLVPDGGHRFRQQQ